jgi:EAL domain-containing protein (putative c-di-GMP-specific phosphodiesterase class I)
MPHGVPVTLRDTRRAITTPVASGHGRLYMWFPDLPSQSKVVQYLTRQDFSYQLCDGNCVLVDAEWERLRDMAIPLRRVLTQFEADDLRVLFKPDGGDLTTADFPRVHSFTQFSLISQSSWLHDLLDERRLTAVFQVIVSAQSPNRVFANEALMRGLGRNGVVLYPGYILDVARACNMLTQVDHAARDAAIGALVRGEIAEKVFINISPGTVHDPAEAVDTTSKVVEDAHIAHDRVVFEVTEADQTLDPGMLRRILSAYRDAGFGVALDDVGAGYSSLNLLHQLRPDYIKIDMELIRGVNTDGYKALIAEKIIEIAHSLNIKTIAEGIETAEELAWVQDHGADYAQGYLIARPTEPRFAHLM